MIVYRPAKAAPTEQERGVPPQMSQVIGFRLFVDGVLWPIYEDAQGQYVVDDDGQRVYGVFLMSEEETCDLPVLVEKSNHAPR